MKKGVFNQENGFASSENIKDGYHPLNAVEKTDQCAGCQRFLRLGSGQYCFTVTDDEIRAAEIVSWTSARCNHYLEMANPFLYACHE